MGEPGNAGQQRVVIEDALHVLATAAEPGAVVDLPYRWLGGDDYGALRRNRERV